MRRALTLGLAIASICTGLQAQSFDLIAHRGARGLMPENTLAGFRKALEIGVTALETDLVVTKDGTVVLSHDWLLNQDITRTADGKWLPATGPAIRSLSLLQLKTYDVGRINPDSRYAKQWPEQTPIDGERIPTLAELVALTRSMGKMQVRFFLETKLDPHRPEDAPDPTTFAKQVLEILRREGIEARTVVQSFDWRSLTALKRMAPELQTACLTTETSDPFMNTVSRADWHGSPFHDGLKLSDYGGSLPRLVKAAGCGTWSVFSPNLTPELVKEAHALGLKVMPWTINDRMEMDRLIGLGVDGIFSDRPDRLRDVMAKRGMMLP